MTSLAPIIFGNPDANVVEKLKEVFSHSDNLFCAILDNEKLHDPAVLDELIEKFPRNMMRDFDLFLMLAECMANAVNYNETKVLGLHIRKRAKLLLVSVYHEPVIPDNVDYILRNAHDGWLPDYDQDPPSGLGFPILFRLAYQITISGDRTRLQLWVRLRNSANMSSTDDP